MSFLQPMATLVKVRPPPHARALRHQFSPSPRPLSILVSLPLVFLALSYSNPSLRPRTALVVRKFLVDKKRLAIF
jgi:hypothetical protein